ncbi:MAG: hypothetical protein KZQ77_19510, partial [Candidatus Thiodiazotropha sp. (ex Notomyrtea botanica)]|nr:hypothetical protein [Candidatus Thiodiazotropha sp. (ex Notomyrtea botanica)]
VTACLGNCNYIIETLSFSDYNTVTDFWYGSYVSTGHECALGTPEGSPNPLPDQPLPPESDPDCKYYGETLVCPDVQDDPECQGQDSVTINGVKTCFDGDQAKDCAMVNGEWWCPDMQNNCGTFNGELVCVQPQPDDIMGPQNSAPEGCIVGADGEIICINHDPIDLETTDVTTNPDGSTTETTTTTDQATGDVTTTTTTTYIDGSSVTTVVTESGNLGGEGGEGGGGVVTPRAMPTLDDVPTERETAEDAWNRILNAPIVLSFANIAQSFPNGTCSPLVLPTPWGDVSTNMICDLYIDIAPILSAVMYAAWTVFGAIIIMSA